MTLDDMIAAKRAAEARARNSITLRDGKLYNEPPPPASPPADLADIERVIRLGMCSPGKLAEGCACCAAKLAAVEAVRAMHERAERAEAKVEAAYFAACGREAALHDQIDRLTRERDDLRTEVERLREDLAEARRERDSADERLDAIDRACAHNSPRAAASSVAHALLLAERERDEALATLATYQDARDLDAIRAALGPHATGDLVADVRRLVEHMDGALHVIDACQRDFARVREALGSHDTGAPVEDVRRLVEREDVLRLYLARALRGCDPAERAAIEADLASERAEVSDG